MIKEKTYFKMFNKKKLHHDLHFRKGITVDPVPFNPIELYTCGEGGLYYIDEDLLLTWCFNPNWGNIARITIPTIDGMEIQTLKVVDKYRSNAIQLTENIRSIYNPKTWNWLFDKHKVNLKNNKYLIFHNNNIVDVANVIGVILDKWNKDCMGLGININTFMFREFTFKVDDKNKVVSMDDTLVFPHIKSIYNFRMGDLHSYVEPLYKVKPVHLSFPDLESIGCFIETANNEVDDYVNYISMPKLTYIECLGSENERSHITQNGLTSPQHVCELLNGTYKKREDEWKNQITSKSRLNKG